MHRIPLAKRALCALAFIIMFQSVPVRADIKGSVSTIVDQLRDSLAIDKVIGNVFENKIASGCLVIIAMILAYKGYFKYTNNRLVAEAEELLGLSNIGVTSSYGTLGKDLSIRKEAIYTVLEATRKPDELLETRLKELLQNPLVKVGLIGNQEKLLKKELQSAKDIWQLDSYGDIARKKLGLSELRQRCSIIGSDSDNPEKKEAYNQLDSKSRYEVAFEVFSRDLYWQESDLVHWQENSIHFKEPLRQILGLEKK